MGHDLMDRGVQLNPPSSFTKHLTSKLLMPQMLDRNKEFKMNSTLDGKYGSEDQFAKLHLETPETYSKSNNQLLLLKPDSLKTQLPPPLLLPPPSSSSSTSSSSLPAPYSSSSNNSTNQLTPDINLLKKYYHDEMAQITKVYKNMESHKNEEIKRLSRALDQVLQESELKIKEILNEKKELEMMLEQERLVAVEMREQLVNRDGDLRGADELIGKCENEMKSLKVECKTLKLENENMRFKLKSMEDHVVRLERDKELMGVRMTAANDILSLQDRQLQDESSSLAPYRKKKGLIEKWRHRVYELMVQLKCQELASKEQIKKLDFKVSQLEANNERSLNELLVCKKLMHARSLEIEHLNKLVLDADDRDTTSKESCTVLNS